MAGTVQVWPLPSLIPDQGEGVLREAAAVIVDLLRASTTIVRALDAGAERVVPFLETADAVATRERLVAGGVAPDRIRLGGERGGLKVPGFDLGNSPAECTRASIGGRTLIFTTTNGTRAIEAARRAGAARILVGCFNNLSAVAAAVGHERAVHIVCAGTDGRQTQEDILCAGAIADRLIASGFQAADGRDTGGAIAGWKAVGARADALPGALRESSGGRNLVEIGLESDIADCARMDGCASVPELRPDGSLTAA